MNAAAFYAAVTIGSKYGYKNGLQYVHHSMVRDPVRIKWQPVHIPLFWLIHFEHSIFRSVVGPVHQAILQGQQISLLVTIMYPHAILPSFSLPGLGIGQPEVVQAADLLVYIADAFHFTLLSKAGFRFHYQPALSVNHFLPSGKVCAAK
jgi:hypothetical protein